MASETQKLRCNGVRTVLIQKGYHLNTKHLQNVGGDFCEALNGLSDSSNIDLQLAKDLNGYAFTCSLFLYLLGPVYGFE